MHKNLKPVLFALLTLTVLWASPSGIALVSAGKAARIAGPLRTSGTTLTDKSNRKVRMLGINSSGMEFGEGNEWNNKDVSPDHYFWATPEEQGFPETYEVVAKSGFNTVRLPISWSNLERAKPTKDDKGKIIHSWNAPFLTALDHVIDQFGKRGIKVVLCMYQWHWSTDFRDPDWNEHGAGMPAWLYTEKKSSQKDAEEQFAFDRNPIFDGYSQQDGYVDAWRLVAERYKNSSVVIAADLLNEPPHHEGFKLKEFYEHTGRAIHLIAPKWALVVDQTHKDDGIPDKPNLPNLIYAVHLYLPFWDKNKGDKPSVKETLQKALRKSRKWGVPLYVCEFGRFGGKEEKEAARQMSEMMRFCLGNDISWTYFPWQPTRRVSLIKRDHHEVRQDLIKLLQSGF